MDILELVRIANGFPEFNPLQQKALKTPLFDQSTVVAAPTASGKTVLAELCGLDSIIHKHQKVVYTCPLRALASEHFSDFKRKYANLKIRVSLSTGDLDSSSKYLENYDFIFSTNEKVDSLIRHKADWLQQVGLLVVDEIHLLGSDRGPTLEIVIAKMKLVNPNLRVLALSATIPNAEQIAEWLKAELVKSDYRPVKLEEGVFFDSEIWFEERTEAIQSEQRDSLLQLVEDTLHQKEKQCLVFVNSRKTSQSAATRLSRITQPKLSPKEQAILQRVSERIANTLEQPTSQCLELAELVKKGAAFHNAGLLQKQRQLVEEAFKRNYLKVICATPTLCLVPETRIWKGLEDDAVSSFNPKDALLALKGNQVVYVKPEAIIKRKNNRTIVSIQSISGFYVKLTENHQVLVKRAGKTFLLPVGKCKAGDKIASVGRLPGPKGKQLTIGDLGKDFPISDQPLTPDFFYFVGAMLGDGYSGAETVPAGLKFKSNPCVVGRDEELFSEVKNACTVMKIRVRPSENYYGVPTLVLSKDKWFRRLLVNCGIEVGEQKHVAPILFNANQDCLRTLIQGLFDSDGCVEKGKTLSFCNISKSLVKDLQRLLLIFGVVCRLRKRPAGTMQIYNKEYKTKPYFELSIAQNNSILSFHREIGFRIKRKQDALRQIVDRINSNKKSISCPSCKYTLYHDLFSGRTKVHKEWGTQKRKIIQLLGSSGTLSSQALGQMLGFTPYKGEKRLDHHFELIDRTRVGNRKDWKLNSIGQHVYRELFVHSNTFEELFNLKTCPLCSTPLHLALRGNWRTKDTDGDIFWDYIRKVSKEKPAKYPFVYDVVLPSDSSNDHLFAAEGFLVHNSAGVNLPAFRVIIPSLYRYEAGSSQRISVSEYKQMAGRAGRPKFDSAGEAILLSNSEIESDELMEFFVKGELEEIESKLSIEPVLRTHLLAAIATDFVFDLQSLEDFFSKTFYAFQFKKTDALFAQLTRILQELQEIGFVESDEKRFKATPLGKRVAELYLDPLAAHEMIQILKQRRAFSPLTYLFLFVQTGELFPLVSVPRKKEPEVLEALMESAPELPLNVEREVFSDDSLPRKFFTARVLEEWVNEKPDSLLSDEFNIAPGLLRSKLLVCDWLSYAAFELCQLLGLENHLEKLGKLRKRLQRGVREELLNLVEVRGIGRVRARRLWNSSVRSVAELKKIDVKDLARVLGSEKVAIQIKQNLGQIPKKTVSSAEQSQSSLQKLE